MIRSPALTRRGVLAGSSLLGLRASSALGKSVNRYAPTCIVDLRTDNLAVPLAIENLAPRLSWRMESTRRGARQVAWRVRVASSSEGLAAGGADLWDSGRVADAVSIGIKYAGAPLSSRHRCWWTVEVWDELGRSTTAAQQGRWEMGLLERSDWTGSWLAAEDRVTAADRAAGLHWIWGADPKPTAPIGFRRVLELRERPVEAVLLVVARDSFDGLWLDGEPIAFTPFRPPAVNNARMLTIPLDIDAGRHVLALQASLNPKGWPASTTGGLAALLRLTYSDGRVERIGTGSGWTVGLAAGDWVGTEVDEKVWPQAQTAGSKPSHDPWPAGPATLLRQPFDLKVPPASARLYVTALGAYEMRLNGRRVGDGLLAPENTDFTKRVLYQVHDVTTMLKLGANVLAAVVGDGWYGSTGLFQGRFSFGAAPCRLLAQLEVIAVDGSREVFATHSDGNWRASESPILMSEIYDGEVYDARREQAGWDAVGFDDSGWRPAAEAPRPDTALVAQITPPIRVTRTLDAIAVREVRPGVHVVDFGQNFSGWCRLSGTAPAGTSVTLRHAEILDAKGDVDQSNLRSAEARDVYVFKGAVKGETYRPTFTYHGFRYVQVTGWKGALPKGFLRAEVLTTDLAETGTFRIDDAQVSKIWLNTLWGQRSNFIGIPTDCPQRDERLGWNGDAQIFWDAAAFNMDVDAFTRRFMGDVRDGQNAKGVFAEFNPQNADAATMRGAPGWADAGILLPYTAWWRYGDTAIIDENWEAMSAYAAHVLRENPDFVWRKARGSDYGDWLALDAKEPGDETTPKVLAATAWWAHVSGRLAEMAGATGRTAEAVEFNRRRDRISAAFSREFIKSNGVIGNGSQTGYILALRFRLVPAVLRAAAAARLVADIRRRGTVLSTGFMGTPHALDVLLDTGHGDLVRALLARTEFPSWGYMVRKGATTMWERWNSDVGDVAMNSFNHYALGAVVGFFYRRLAGIDASLPGFKKIDVRPAEVPGFNSAGATYDSVRGRVSVDWRIQGDRVSLELIVPPNTSARVRIPKRQGRYLGIEDRNTVDAQFSPGGGAMIFEAGHHSIQMSPT